MKRALPSGGGSQRRVRRPVVPPIDPNATHGNAAICRREYANLVAGGNNVVNFLGLDHSVYGKIKNNPGEVVALIKTMLDLAAKGNEVDWRKNRSIYMPGSVGPDQANNTTKSVTFKTLLATHLGERISAFRENI